MLEYNIIVGIDLGQQTDYTVLSILELIPGSHQNKPLYNLVYVYRVPLKTPYPLIINWIVWVVETMLSTRSYIVIVDYTGVGRPIVDALRDKEIHLIAANITSGSTAHWRYGTEVGIPKIELVTTLLLVLNTLRLRIPKATELLEHLIQEFVSFKKAPRINHGSSYEAAQGYHDDIVISISLAVWYGEFMAKGGNSISISSEL